MRGRGRRDGSIKNEGRKKGRGREKARKDFTLQSCNEPLNSLKYSIIVESHSILTYFITKFPCKLNRKKPEMGTRLQVFYHKLYTLCSFLHPVHMVLRSLPIFPSKF